MNILLTNDDGIHSEGLWAIAQKLCEIADVTVVVPDRDQSGMGASMTLLKPLSFERVQPRTAGCMRHIRCRGLLRIVSLWPLSIFSNQSLI